MAKITPIDTSTKLPFLTELFGQLHSNASDAYRFKALDKMGLMPGAPTSYNAIANLLNNENTASATREAAQGAFERMGTMAGGFEGQMAANPLKTKLDINGTTVNPLKYNMGALGSAIKAHPFKAAGIGALGAANLAGLFDNEQIGGQLIGGLGGGALAHFLPVSPIAKVAIGLGGGTLGSLFDKLRAKKAEEQAMAQQYAQY